MLGMTVCSGIGAPEHAAPWIDWRYQSEIEPFPCAVLAERFPDAVNLGDMTKFKEWPDAAIDVLCGGTPCQAFSVAGLRKGLDDPRGNLMLTHLAIAARYRPRWLVWENVPGVLSSNGGRDFGAFLGGLGELGYGFAYRVLDVQFGRTLRFPFAIPQRRRRVFVVGYLGDWRRAAAVLFDRESLSGNPPPRREAGQVASPTLSARTKGGGGLGSDFEIDGGLIPETAGTLRAEGFDASEDGTRRQTLIATSDVANCLTAQNGQRNEVSDMANGHLVVAPVASTLNAAFGEKLGLEDQHINSGAPLFVIQERAVSENPDAGPGGAGWNDAGAAYTLEARQQVQAVGFSCKDNGRDATEDLAPTMRSMNGERPSGGGHLAVAFDLRGREGGAMPEGPHETANIRAASGGSSRSYVALPWAVRRLTPTECERLMGFPDGWTQIAYRNKPADKCPDGPRYKALGNSWGVNAGEYVFDRIRMVEGLA